MCAPRGMTASVSSRLKNKKNEVARLEVRVDLTVTRESFFSRPL